MPGFKPKERRLPSRRYFCPSLSPPSHYVKVAQAIRYRGAGFDSVRRSFAIVAAIGLLFTVGLVHFSRTVAVS
jgi:ABC-2 type transport system permease protein